MKCGDCGNEIAAGATTCSVCGVDVEYFCPKCGAVLSGESEPCPKCAAARQQPEMVVKPDGTRVCKFPCPVCRQRIAVPPEWSERMVYCPACHEKIRIPAILPEQLTVAAPAGKKPAPPIVTKPVATPEAPPPPEPAAPANRPHVGPPKISLNDPVAPAPFEEQPEHEPALRKLPRPPTAVGTLKPPTLRPASTPGAPILRPASTPGAPTLRPITSPGAPTAARRVPRPPTVASGGATGLVAPSAPRRYDDVPKAAEFAPPSSENTPTSIPVPPPVPPEPPTVTAPGRAGRMPPLKIAILALAAVILLTLIGVGVKLALPVWDNPAALQGAMSKMRVLGSALQIYAADYSGALPPGEGAGGLTMLLRNAGGMKADTTLSGRGSAVAATGDQIAEENSSFAYLGGGLVLEESGATPPDLPILIEKPWDVPGGRVTVLFRNMQLQVVPLPESARAGCREAVLHLQRQSADPGAAGWKIVSGNAGSVDFACGR